MSLRIPFAAFFLFAMTLPVNAGEHETVGKDAELVRHMQLHFTAARALRTFIISGELDGVPQSADWLIDHETPPGLPDGWQPYVEDMRQYAIQAKNAGHLFFAAEALSEMARTCGACHQANGASVSFVPDSAPPPQGDLVKLQMRRHLWAVERMWEGLIGPSDDAWNQGAAVLAGTDLDSDQFDVPAEKLPTLEYLLSLRQQIGLQGLAAETPSARSALYGEFLGLCSDCHGLVGRGPQPPRTVMPVDEQ